MMKPKLLFLFPECWDRCALQADTALPGELEVVGEGFDLFRFPENARILWFDVRRFVDRLVRKYRHAGVVGVVSTNEQYGALIAATVAQRLGLPGTDPVSVIRAQHKGIARKLTAATLPEASPRYTVFPWTVDPAVAAALPYPLFVKPVKAAYSVLARRVDRVEELEHHLEFGAWEKQIIRRLVKPFNDLMRDLLPGDEFCDAHHLIGEEPLDGVQINVDGYVARGAAYCLGVVDSVMYPGTIAFQRFEYPSRLPQSAQRDAERVACRALETIGFDHGLFNVELFWRPRDGAIKIIEINPRLAAQFADLYEKVDGMNPYRVLADLAIGREPRWVRRAGRYGAAASFVFREFDGAIKVAPSRAEIRWLQAAHPDICLQTFIKHGASRGREMKWLGSYRYATVNIGGRNREDLFRRYDSVCSNLAFERPARLAFGNPLAALRPGR
ncbi:MAG: ATP-grasp domain-containing protein [Betaproteobacteria bacterium]|nr:MAG: ATP-grasp domain-containing protein [Betaproteobacteria bacterium]